MEKTYEGGCHCKAVLYECELDLALETSRCNCSICLKGRYWKAMAAPSAFRLLRGGDALTAYNFGSGTITHLFCRLCGIKPFARVTSGNRERFAVNIATLDNAPEETLAHAPVRFQNGRGDRWDEAPSQTSFL